MTRTTTFPVGGGALARLRAMKREHLVAVGVLAVLFLAGLVLLLTSGGRGVGVGLGLGDDSEEVFALGPGDDPRSHGCGPVDVQCCDRANFAFEYGGGRVVLEYQVGGIDDEKEIVIKLNGTPLGYAPLAIDRYAGRRLDLPRPLLKRGRNVVSFDNTRNPPARDTWGVKRVRASEEPLPQPDPAKARQLFEVAKSRFDARDVAWPNRYQAWDLYRQARDYLELMPEKPDFYDEAIEGIRILEEELQRRYQEAMFEARRALRYGRQEEAVAQIKNVLLMFPDAQDPRHRDALEELKALGDGAAQ
jgi:hypothetical protein